MEEGTGPCRLTRFPTLTSRRANPALASLRWHAILGLNRYLERQKAAEAKPETLRRQELLYDVAPARLGKGACPGCEREVDLKNDKLDFCPHCGIGLFDHCGACAARKSTFSKYCLSCGAAAAQREATSTAGEANLG